MIGSLLPDWGKIQQKVISIQNYVDFPNLSSSTKYLLKFDGKVFTSGGLHLRINGDTGNNYYYQIAALFLGDQYYFISENPGAKIPLNYDDISNGYGFKGEIEIDPDFLNNSQAQFVDGFFRYVDLANTRPRHVTINGWRSGGGLSSIRIYPVSGTLSGKFILYGWI